LFCLKRFLKPEEIVSPLRDRFVIKRVFSDNTSVTAGCGDRREIKGGSESTTIRIRSD